jgi:hypothetical protein
MAVAEVIDPEIEAPFRGGPADGEQVFIQLGPGAAFPDRVELSFAEEFAEVMGSDDLIPLGVGRLCIYGFTNDGVYVYLGER